MVEGTGWVVGGGGYRVGSGGGHNFALSVHFLKIFHEHVDKN